MPQNKRESLIFTVMMCFFMVFFMSIYNVACHHGALNLEIVKDAWIGFPIAYCFAMCCDWFLVSGLAKGFAFRFLVKPESEPFKKAIAVSCCMVVPMVIIMSFYGAMEAIVSGGAGWNQLLLIWITNIPRNFIMALPLQLLIAGPFIRGLFRKLFPDGIYHPRPGNFCVFMPSDLPSYTYKAFPRGSVLQSGCQPGVFEDRSRRS